MSFCDHAKKFNDQYVSDFSMEKGIENPEITYRIRTDWDSEIDAYKAFEQFLNDPKLPQIKNFIIGLWELEAFEVAPTRMVEMIVANKEKLQHIKGIFFGDITYEENEISWISNTDHSVILDALPNLEIYQVRGGNDLSLGSLNHPNLKKLIIETGGMDSKILKEIAGANLPNLTHLELWLGSSYYGFDSSAEEVAATFRGKNPNHLPALKYLGLRNCEVADELAKLLIGHPIMDRIEVLDLSKGTISDAGAEALVNNPKVQSLKKLNLDHSYITDKWAAKLKKLTKVGVQVSLDEREPDEAEEDRYVCVGE